MTASRFNELPTGGRSAAADRTLIRSLRRPGDEVQLTRTIDALARADTGFAWRLLKLLLQSAPNNAEALKRWDQSSTVMCTAERAMRVAPGQTRRVDLVLESSQLTLFIEVKLRSDYQPNQLRDYLQAIEGQDGAYLVAVTRDVSRYREPDAGTPQWLGVIRWPRLAAALPGLPSDGPVKQHWELLLEVLKEDGDLGSSTLPPELIHAYERSDDAYERLTDFLEHIAEGTLQRLRSELSRGDSIARDAAAFATARRRRIPSNSRRGRADIAEDYPEVLSEDEQLYLAFQIPAGGVEVLWIGFYVDEGAARFFVGAGWGGERDPSPEWEANWRTAARRLKTTMRQRDFRLYNDDLYCQVDYPLAHLAQANDVPDALARQIDEDLPQIVKSGIFDVRS